MLVLYFRVSRADMYPHFPWLAFKAAHFLHDFKHPTVHKTCKVLYQILGKVEILFFDDTKVYEGGKKTNIISLFFFYYMKWLLHANTMLFPCLLHQTVESLKGPYHEILLFEVI